VLVLAGSPGMTGAAYLCSKAALRSGSGIVTLGEPEPCNGSETYLRDDTSPAGNKGVYVI